ncbi:MAG: hypothetical protein SF069_15200 [Phycisphaerae bacterium]|nr:hypothetical protein [Phycisphaerae bacterium]
MRFDRRLWPAKSETYEQMRARMIAETSDYLTECLRRPELAPRIPMIETGTGTFPPSMSKAFWDSILFG